VSDQTLEGKVSDKEMKYPARSPRRVMTSDVQNFGQNKKVFKTPKKRAISNPNVIPDFIKDKNKKTIEMYLHSVLAPNA
jgi:hypothetical protein